MKKYIIAELNVILNCGKITMRNAEKYSSSFDNFDISINTEQSIINTIIEKRNMHHDIAEYLWESSDFYRKLLDFNGMMLHSSAVVVDNKAYLFSAPCGTGKSTHTGKWLELFGDKAYILNDDKPAIRILDDGIYAYGTPWSGKHDISANKKVPLQGICFLTRDKENWIKPMDKNISSFRMYHASMRKLTSEQLNKELDIINKIVENVPIYEMGCTPTIDAAQMAYDIMSKGEVKYNDIK